MSNHESWKSNIVKTPNPVLKQVRDYAERLMSNNAGIEDESKYNLEEEVDTVSPDPEVPPFFWVQTPKPVLYEGGGVVTRTPQVKKPRTLQRNRAGDRTEVMLKALEEAAGGLQPPGGALQDRTKELQEAPAAGSVVAGSVAAGSVAAGSLAAGSVTAGSVTAGAVAAGAVAPQVPIEPPRCKKESQNEESDELLVEEDEVMELRKEEAVSEERRKEKDRDDGSEELQELKAGSENLRSPEGGRRRRLGSMSSRSRGLDMPRYRSRGMDLLS